MTCLGRNASSEGVVGEVLSDAWSRFAAAAGFLSLEDATSCSSATSFGGVDGVCFGDLSELGFDGFVLCTVGLLVACAACFLIFPAPRSVDMLMEELPLDALFRQERSDLFS
jgi:hypothetical protein